MTHIRKHTAALAQLFRPNPVISWGVSAFLLGFAVAVYRQGMALNYVDGLLGLVLVLLAQGFVSHGLNDAVDWLTGTDKESIGKGTGGSRVIPEGKMTVVGTLLTAIVALLGVVGIGLYFVTKHGLPMLVLFAIAIWSPVSYSTPPLKLGYRPFNELVVVLPALVGVVVGADMVLGGSVSILAVLVGAVHALFCIHWFIISRVPDYKPDKAVGKITSVVFVGRQNAGLLSAVYLSLALVPAAFLVLNYTPLLAILLMPWAACLYSLTGLDPYDPENASRLRLRNMRLTSYNALLMSIALIAPGAL